MKEYWIVLAPERRVEVYRHLEQGRYQKKQVFGPGDTMECVGVPSVRLNVAEPVRLGLSAPGDRKNELHLSAIFFAPRE